MNSLIYFVHDFVCTVFSSVATVWIRFLIDLFNGSVCTSDLFLNRFKIDMIDSTGARNSRRTESLRFFVSSILKKDKWIKQEKHTNNLLYFISHICIPIVVIGLKFWFRCCWSCNWFFNSFTPGHVLVKWFIFDRKWLCIPKVHDVIQSDASNGMSRFWLDRTENTLNKATRMFMLQ